MYPNVRASITYRRTVRPCSGLDIIACLDYLFSLIHRACLIAVVLDLRGADDMFVVSDIEQSHARRLAANHAQGIEPHANELRLIGDEHQMVVFPGGEAGDDRTVP